MGLGSGIRKKNLFRIPDLGVKKGTGFRIRNTGGGTNIFKIKVHVTIEPLNDNDKELFEKTVAESRKSC